jgi:hypothetical protein
MSWRPAIPTGNAGELIFPADLIEELRAWPEERWAALGVDLEEVAAALVGCWRRGDIRGLQWPLEPGEDPRALTRPAMTLARAQLRKRLGGLVVHVRRRWLHPTSSRRPGGRFLLPCDCGSVRHPAAVSVRRWAARGGTVHGCPDAPRVQRTAQQTPDTPTHGD